jgi:hypothetical protein
MGRARTVHTLAAAVLLTVAAAMASQKAAASGRWSGTGIVAALQARRLSLDRATITGDIDFRRFDVVEHPFSCRECTIRGRVLGDDVVFASTLDLTGAHITKPVLMRRARFRGPVLFGPTPGPSGRVTSFAGSVDFSFARFDDLAMFANASFEERAEFTSTRFDSTAVVADATFKRGAGFERASFGADADFRAATFIDDDANRRLTRADRQKRGNAASFAATRFDDRADFSRSTFKHGYVIFRDARFARDLTFVGATFADDGGTRIGVVTFERAVAERNVVFDLATFAGGAIFQRTVVGGVLSYDEARFWSRKPLVFTETSAKGIVLDVDDALAMVAHGQDQDDRPHVLKLIESAAKDSGDLGVANDARFSLEVLESRREHGLRHLLNVVFYRLVAGYFVRPFHPIMTLLLLAGVVAIARAFRAGDAATGAVRRGWIRLSAAAREYIEALALIGPHADAGRERRIETFVYRLLIFCALIALGNSNPTLREMFDAIV